MGRLVARSPCSGLAGRSISTGGRSTPSGAGGRQRARGDGASPRRARQQAAPAFGSGRSDRVGRRGARALLSREWWRPPWYPPALASAAATHLRPTVRYFGARPHRDRPVSRCAVGRAGGFPTDTCRSGQYHRRPTRSYDADALISAQYLWGATGAVRGPQAPRYRGRSPQASPGGDLHRSSNRGKWRPLDVSGILNRAEHAHRRSFTLFWAVLFVLSLALQYGSFAAPATTLAGAKTEITICHATASHSNPCIVNSPSIDSNGFDDAVLSGGHNIHVGPVWFSESRSSGATSFRRTTTS